MVIVLLACVALAVVLAPLRRAETTERMDLTAELEAKKMTALNAILDLESERDVGKLTEADFNELRAVYEGRALDLIHELEDTHLEDTDLADPVLDDTGHAESSDPLEREIALVRKRLGSK